MNARCLNRALHIMFRIAFTCDYVSTFQSDVFIQQYAHSSQTNRVQSLTKAARQSAHAFKKRLYTIF